MSQDESRVSLLGCRSSVAATTSELHDSSWEGGIIIVYYSEVLFIIIIANYCLLADKATASRAGPVTVLCIGKSTFPLARRCSTTSSLLMLLR